MKTNKVVLFILVFVIFLLLLSCGTRKSVKIQQKDMHTESVDSIHVVTGRRDTFEWSKLETTRTGIRITITDLSQPDSLGKQHPTKKTEITIDNKKESNETASSGSELQQEGMEVNKNKQDDKNVLETRKDTDTRFVPVWAWWVLVITISILVLVGYEVKKKRKS